VRRLLLGLIAVLAVAGAAVYWFVLRDDAPPPAALPAASPAGTPASPNGTRGSPAGTWMVRDGPGVFAGYRIHELFGGDSLSRTAVGRTPAVTGSLTVAGSTVSAASVRADLTQLQSDQARRDNYIRSHAIESATYPDAAFRLTQPIVLPGPPVAGRPLSVVAHGTLTLHGVTRLVSVPLQVRWDGETISVAGGAEITLADYGIGAPDIAGLVSVSPAGVFEVQLTFVAAQGQPPG
jgi:polyisoprenoid-binding protein YceI